MTWRQFAGVLDAPTSPAFGGRSLAEPHTRHVVIRAAQSGSSSEWGSDVWRQPQQRSWINRPLWAGGAPPSGEWPRPWRPELTG